MTANAITGAVLAGGRARRMGGDDKGLVPLGGRCMVQWVLDALRPQVDTLLINANRNAARYAELGACPVVADRQGDFAGPLAGMAAALETAATPLLLTVPCDSPLLGPDLAARMSASLARERAALAVAHDGARLQPVFALLRRDLLDDLLAFLDGGGRKIDAWYARHRTCSVDFSDRPRMFVNVNTPEERAALECELTAAAGGPP